MVYLYRFTFHYVYIYMQSKKVQAALKSHLHSTMFIFISCSMLFPLWLSLIYIPLCLYLYDCIFQGNPVMI